MRFTVEPSDLSLIDTVLCFVRPGTPVTVTCPELIRRYGQLPGANAPALRADEIRTFLLPAEGRFLTLIASAPDPEACEPLFALRKQLKKIAALLPEIGTQHLLIDSLPDTGFAAEAEILSQIASILPLGDYSFDKYKSDKKEHRNIEVSFSGLSISRREEEHAILEGEALADSVMTARDLINENACELTPSELARRAGAVGKPFGITEEILNREQCEKLGMGLFLAVAEGSRYEPKFIILRWNGGKEGEAPVALVGKGITYDTGGLALKKSSMELMRFDMNGAASVIGAILTAARVRLPINIIAVVAACENAVGPDAYRNGDVFRSMSGQTVFVQNTDAEGRLTMADAITYCARCEHPREIIEIAGLTGSASSFYGKVCAAAFTRTKAMFDRLESVMEISGERYALMPHFPEYREMLKSPYADLDNAPAGEPGAILAAEFLDCFHDRVPFMSIDSAAMPFTRTPSDCQPAGGTGFGVRSLYYYLKSLSLKD